MEAQPDGAIRFVFDNISKLQRDDTSCSHEVEVKGVPWIVGIDNCGELAITLDCTTVQATYWRADVDIEFTLVHPDNKDKNIIEKESGFVAKDQVISVYLMSWDDLIENEKGFIVDDKITVEVRFWVSNMEGFRRFPLVDFTDADEPIHDVALAIDGEKIYASKQILASHSPVFRAMFYGEFAEKHQKEIELKDIDREEFLEMLRVIYPSCKKITDDSAEYLLKLADRFQIEVVLYQGQKYLIDSCKFSNTEKLRIADQYRLFGLKHHCLSTFKTKKDFQDVKESPIYKDLSHETRGLLFENLIKIDE